MENASKALLIAAGMLVGLILITMIIHSTQQISSYYKAKEESEESKQMAEFNKQFIGYNRDDVRGSDLLSLVNKIIDYNTINSDAENIEISIIIGGQHENFYYKYEDIAGQEKLIRNNFTQNNINSVLIDPATTFNTAGLSQGKADKLANNISTLMGENSNKTPEELLNEIKVSEYNIDVLKDDILQYYQYKQFKRAHFDCKELIYQNGIVRAFEFEFNGIFE